MSREKELDASNELYNPPGLKLKKEYIQGFGKRELESTIFTSLIFVIADCLIYIFGVRNVGVFFFVPLIGISVVVMMHIKGELNLSPLDIIKMEIRFLKEQRNFPYVAKNEWEND